MRVRVRACNRAKRDDGERAARDNANGESGHESTTDTTRVSARAGSNRTEQRIETAFGDLLAKRREIAIAGCADQRIAEIGLAPRDDVHRVDALRRDGLIRLVFLDH